jgi:hypothetical protein
MDDVTRPVWIRGPQLRKRWGSGDRPMPNSTFFDRLKKGLIPKPEFPFGEGTPPHWRLKVIEALERKAVEAAGGAPTAAAPPPEAAPKRKPGRPRKATPNPKVMRKTEAV